MQIFSGFISLIVRGGPAMVGLLGCSILVVAVVFERSVFLVQHSSRSEELVRDLGERLAHGDATGAVRLCDKARGVLPKILKAGLLRSTKSRTEVVDALSTSARKYLRGFDQNLGILGTIAVIAPFVGLFGTVLGIIHAFDDIALKGNSSPAVVAAGVSEALITTAAGLFVAVISVIFFNYFRTRAHAVREDTLWAAEQLAELLDFRNTNRLSPADVSALLDIKPATNARV